MTYSKKKNRGKFCEKVTLKQKKITVTFYPFNHFWSSEKTILGGVLFWSFAQNQPRLP